MAENEIRVAVGGDSSNVAITAGAATLGNKKRIHKIPPHLRSKEDSDYVYDPKVVSIGPYHHGKPELQLVQRIKHKVLDNFISNSSSSQQKQDYEFYFKKMLEVVHRARSCYIMESISEFDDLEFAEMMLLDGCFLLNHFLVTTDYGDDFARAREYYSPLDITTLMTIDVAAGIIFTERDTILLENQIPLWIIKLLFKARYGNEAAGIGSIPKMSRKEFSDECGYLFRSVMDLKSKGIHFSRNYTDYYTLRAIKFESNFLRAKVKLPVFDASTVAQVSLQNLIAYELCNFTRTQFVVGSYINFMRSLIVSPGDVKELREKRIIRSTLGEDKEVVKLFHGLNTYDFDNPIILRDIKHKILKGIEFDSNLLPAEVATSTYNSRIKTWMAEFAYTYFRSPWTAIALFAAAFLLALISLQTYFTVNPRGN
nr:UPF0481 protein At3g47200-like [Ipomoea batatas]